MSDYAIDAVDRYSTEQPTPALRWLASRDMPKRLQQRWVISTYENGVIAGQRLEWRDVQTEGSGTGMTDNLVPDPNSASGQRIGHKG